MHPSAAIGPASRLIGPGDGPQTHTDAQPAPASDTDNVCTACGGRFPASYRLCPEDGAPLDASKVIDALIGRVLGGTYRILRPLRSGGMGRLYEVEHVRLGRRLALKVVHEVYADHPDAVARFEREARAASRIDSDCVVSVIDVLRAPDGRPAIVSELLDGEDLQVRLDRTGPLTVGEAVAIARRVCLGVAAAHAAGVLHRDLKPSNVFLSVRPEGGTSVKILDFGVAKLEGDRDITKSDAVLGTPAYMAPEQARGAAKVGSAVDVYGVGALLYRMLSGAPPYAGHEPTSTLAQLLEGPPKRVRTLRRDVPAGLEAIVERAMARDPSLRFESATALEHALRPFDVGEWVDTPTSAGSSRLASNGDETLAAPRGSVAVAERLSRRARLLRPRAALEALGLGLIAGAVANATLITLYPSASLAARGAVFAIAAGLASFLALRALAQRWSSAPAIERFSTVVRGANAAFVTAFGVAALLASAELVGAPLRTFAFQLGLAVLASLVAAHACAKRGACYETRNSDT